MTEQEQTPQSEEPTGDQWDSITKDFQALGQSIADAVKGAWQDENYRQQLKDLGAGLQTMANQVVQVVDEAIKSPVAEEAKTEVKRAAVEVKDLGGKVYADSKPHLLSALKKVGEGLQTIITNLESAEPQMPPSDKTE